MPTAPPAKRNVTLALTEDGLEVRDGADGGMRDVVDPDEAKAASDRAFVHAVLGGDDDVRVPYDEALRTHRLACAVARSAASAGRYGWRGIRMSDGEQVLVVERPRMAAVHTMPSSGPLQDGSFQVETV